MSMLINYVVTHESGLCGYFETLAEAENYIKKCADKTTIREYAVSKRAALRENTKYRSSIN